MYECIPLSELADVDIKTVNKGDLVDVSGLVFDTTVPMEQRAAWLFERVKNPYCFRVGDIAVKIDFMDNAPPLQDILIDFLRRQKSGL